MIHNQLFFKGFDPRVDQIRLSKTFSFSNEKFDEFFKDIVDLQKSFQELIEKEKFFNENNIVKKHFRLSLDNVIRICFGEIPIISQRTINSDQCTREKSFHTII